MNRLKAWLIWRCAEGREGPGYSYTRWEMRSWWRLFLRVRRGPHIAMCAIEAKAIPPPLDAPVAKT